MHSSSTSTWIPRNMSVSRLFVLLCAALIPLRSTSQSEVAHVRIIFQSTASARMDGIRFEVEAYAAGAMEQRLDTRFGFIEANEGKVTFAKGTIDDAGYLKVKVTVLNWQVDGTDGVKVGNGVKDDKVGVYYKPGYDPSANEPNTTVPLECRLIQIKTESDEIVRLRTLLAETQDMAEAARRALQEATSREASNVRQIERMGRVIDSLEITTEQISSRLKQQERTEYYAAIASGLTDFKERLLNLRQVLKPSTVRDAFLYDSTRKNMTRMIQLYAVARDELAITRHSNVARVKSYWPDNGPDPPIADRLDSLYTLALTSINQKILLEQVNDKILSNINASGTGRIPRVTAQRRSVKVMKEIEPRLDRLIGQFVMDSDKILASLKEI